MNPNEQEQLDKRDVEVASREAARQIAKYDEDDKRSCPTPGDCDWYCEHWEAAVAAIIASALSSEREACAKIAEQMFTPTKHGRWDTGYVNAGIGIAAAIRAKARVSQEKDQDQG